MLEGVRMRGRTVRPEGVVVERPSERDVEGDRASEAFGGAKDGGLKVRRLNRLRKEEGDGSVAAGSVG